MGTEHRLIPPKHPQTNGMVERFNGRISELVACTRFASEKELRETLMHYMDVYNRDVPQRALGHLSPQQAMRKWREERPDLFRKSDNNLAGLDTILSKGGYMSFSRMRLSNMDGCTGMETTMSSNTSLTQSYRPNKALQVTR